MMSEHDASLSKSSQHQDNSSSSLNKYSCHNWLGYGNHPPAPKWPKGGKVALNFVIHYQEGGDDDSDETKSRNLLDESADEYGARAGFWRFHRLFTKKKMPVTVMAVALALERNPAVCHALRDAVNQPSTAHWEVATQGYRYNRTPENNDNDDEMDAADLQKVISIHEKLIGQRPVGYCSGMPSIKTRQRIVDIEMFKYDSDSYADDLPYWTLGHGSRPHLIVPFTMYESDDKFATADNFFKHLKDTLRYLVEEGRAGQPKMMTVALHCRLANPARVAAVSDFVDYAKSFGREVWLCTREDIADFWIANHSPRGAGSPVKVQPDGTFERTGSNGGSVVSEDASSKSGILELKGSESMEKDADATKDGAKEEDAAKTEEIEGDII